MVLRLAQKGLLGVHSFSLGNNVAEQTWESRISHASL